MELLNKPLEKKIQFKNILLSHLCCKIVEAQDTQFDCEYLGLEKNFQKKIIGTKETNAKKKKEKYIHTRAKLRTQEYEAASPSHTTQIKRH